jgi:hypothetical protein
MKNLLQDIKSYFNNNMVLYRLVLINVIVFIGVNFIDLFGFLFGLEFSLNKVLRLFFGLEAGVMNFIWKPWLLVNDLLIAQRAELLIYRYLHNPCFVVISSYKRLNKLLQGHASTCNPRRGATRPDKEH